MRGLGPQEKLLIGRWNVEEGMVAEDNVCLRIWELVKSYLTKVATDASGWDVLYLDPADGRYWERILPSSEMHGGGPPTLRNISLEVARRKYRLQ